MAETGAKLKEIKKIVAQMEAVRQPLLEQWKQLARYILPQRGLFPDTTSDAHSILESRNKEIVTRMATNAVKKAAAGFTSGMTPESLPWVKWSLRDVTLEERYGVRVWLDIVQDNVRTLLKQGGFYQAIHTFNQELLTFGHAMMFMDYSPKSLARFSCCTVGTFCVSLDADGFLDTVCRTISMPPRQIEKMFGKSSMSEQAKKLLDNNPFEPIKVMHVVRPRDNYDPEKIDSKNMPFESIFYEMDTGASDILHEGGYHEMPYMFSSWDDGLTFYGTGPGDDALPDIMQLQEMETQTLIAIDKMLNPPVRVPSNFKMKVNDYAHGKTPIPASVEPHAFSPLYQSSMDLNPVALKAQEIASRINDTLLTSIFTDMPIDLRPKDMSATEYMERKRERLQMMGPTLASYEPKVLVPILERAYGVLDRANLLPPPPQVLVESPGAVIDFSFESPLAQAMDSTKAAATKSLLMDLMQIAPIDNDVLLKVDTVQAIDELARGVGVPGRVLRSDDEVEAMKKQRAAQQAAAQQQAMQSAMVDDVTKLASVPAGEGSVIGALTGEEQQ